MRTPKVTLDQWRAFHAVIDCGGFAKAALQLNRSQSSVSHSVNKLQNQLGIKLLHIEGRKSVLSEAGKILLQRSRQLIDDACAIELQANHLEQGWEAEIRLAVEAAYPTHQLMSALKLFKPLSNKTRIRLQEVVLSGAEDILREAKADLLISPFVPKGFLGEKLTQVNFVAVAHPEHALFKLNREITTDDLKRETHVIVSDSGSKGIDAGWVSDSQRWSVNNMDSAKKIISNGLGYGWLLEEEIESSINNKKLKYLPLNEGQKHTSILYLIYANLNQAGPATKQLAEILKQVSQ
ncbi:MAG: LysR family transcriptional regulator [endosymbiont of Galathealinum brachiosum]|uniref:LysR family transcriptional regulator n=1 Tax=endosymbiont of Galathealinum brachiosum TaxID=2200906 RepID=A0A370DM57_9GAMM|nr:MAG: LysR family transcriptional regulator [endosymbiont of Galathealinum brachiosum]